MLEYLAARAGYAFLAPWSPELAARLGRTVVGPVLYATLHCARRRGLANLDRAFGASLPQAAKRRLLKQMFGHLAQNAAAFFLYPRPAMPPAPFLMDDESRTVLEQINRTRTPVVFVTAHLGNWELFGLTGGGVSLRLNTVARPLDNAKLNRWVTSRRETGPQKMCAANGAPVVLSAALRKRQAVVLLVDQNQRKHGVFVDFFGLPAATTRTPALLSLRTGAPVIPACLVREAQPFQFRAYFAPPLFPRPDQPVEVEVQRITQAFTSTLENWIRRYPDQWLWCHRRWRTQPDAGGGSAPGTPGERLAT